MLTELIDGTENIGPSNGFLLSVSKLLEVGADDS